MLMKNQTKSQTFKTDDVRKMHKQENPETKLFKTYLVGNNHLTLH